MVKLVGILNITPDSFSDGGKFLDPETAIIQLEKLFADGASLVDIGAESTRPHATPLEPDEEWQRLEPVLRVALSRWPGKISLDTYRPETVRRAFEIGPVMINDVTGMNDPEMIRAVTELQAPCIISQHPHMSLHMSHQTMPVSTVDEVKHDLLAKALILSHKGIRREQIILDPGIGFGKTMELNTQLLNFAQEVPDYNVMIGYSRKRFLGENRMDLAVNLTAGKIAAEAGAAYLRVHDVKGHKTLLG